MKVLFRTLETPEAGSGHLRRCITLADALTSSGHECIFLVGDGIPLRLSSIPGRFGRESLERDRDGEWFIRSDAAHPITTSVSGTARPCDWLVIDDRTLDAHWESMMRPHASNILVIDDVAERQHDCDVVVDQVIYRQPEDYDGLVPPTAKLLIGTRYAILRPRFAELRIARRNKVRNSGLQKIFVAMGGTDPHGRLPAVLRGLDRLSLSASIQVIVVVAETRHLEELRGTIQNVRYPCDLRVDPSDIEDLMAECDLAVSAGGMTSYELACLEIPTLIVPATSLEARVAMALSARGGIVVVPSTPADLESQVSSGVKKLLAGLISRANTEVRDLELDGRGVSRVVRVMEQLRQWPDKATSLTNEGNELIP